MKKILWNELRREEQDLYLTLLWRDGHSENAIAAFFGTTKGPIVVRRQRELKLSTEGRQVIKKEVDSARFQELLETRATEKSRETANIPAPSTRKKVRLKLAASEHSQCIHEYPDGGRCGFEKLPDKEWCKLHSALNSKK